MTPKQRKAINDTLTIEEIERLYNRADGLFAREWDAPDTRPAPRTRKATTQ